MNGRLVLKKAYPRKVSRSIRDPAGDAAGKKYWNSIWEQVATHRRSTKARFTNNIPCCRDFFPMPAAAMPSKSDVAPATT